jgi:hypothetical protein
MPTEAIPAAHPARGKDFVGVVVVVQADANLLQIDSLSRLTPDMTIRDAVFAKKSQVFLCSGGSWAFRGSRPRCYTEVSRNPIRLARMVYQIERLATAARKSQTPSGSSGW